MGTVIVKSGESVLYTINTDKDGNVDNVKAASGAPIDEGQMKTLLKGIDLGVVGTEQKDEQTWSLDKLFTKLGTAQTDAKGNVDSAETMKRLEALNTALQSLKQKIIDEKDVKGDPKKAKVMEESLNLGRKLLAQLFKAVDVNELNAKQKATLSTIAGANDLEDKSSGVKPGKASMEAGTPQPQTQTQAQQQAQQQAPAQQPQYPGGAKASELPGGGGAFDLNNYLQSSMFQTLGLNSLDSLGKTQMDQKKMMMLFMYFAMMAMSGDIGAMTAFMQFITTIITKDKSQQNINMANKLIEMEDNSRKATQLLLDKPSYDPNDTRASVDFTKTLEKVKAEQGSIATSQKLIAQMMEEFAQVSEFLNNLQKSLLDVRGRILSRISSFNA